MLINRTNKLLVKSASVLLPVFLLLHVTAVTYIITSISFMYLQLLTATYIIFSIFIMYLQLLTAAIAGSLKLNTDLKVERIYDLKQVIEDN